MIHTRWPPSYLGKSSITFCGGLPVFLQARHAARPLMKAASYHRMTFDGGFSEDFVMETDAFTPGEV